MRRSPVHRLRPPLGGSRDRGLSLSFPHDRFAPAAAPARVIPGLIRLLAVALLLGVAGCGPEPPAGTGEPPSSTADPVTPVRSSDRVSLRADQEQAAVAPFGMLRVAALEAPPGGDADQVGFRHARGPQGEVADLHLGLVLADRGPARVGRSAAGPGWLTVVEDATGLRVEVTTTGRAARYRLTPGSTDPYHLTLAWSGPADHTRLEPARGRRAVTGTLVDGAGGELHLALRADRSFTVVPPTEGASAPGTLELRFEPGGGELHLRLAFSTVDLSAARANLAELGEGAVAFDRTVHSVGERWDRWLARLSVSGDDATRAALTTDLYRVLARYGDITDLDGRYRGPDGAVRRAPPGSAHLGNLDLPRDAGALISLLALLAPERAGDLVSTLLAHERATGRFPVATRWGRDLGETNALAPALPILAGLAVRDLPGVDVARALPAMIKAGTLEGSGVAWDEYQALGYFPFDRVPVGAVTRSLEASEAHHAIAAVAAELGERSVAQAFAVRALFYRQLWDPDAALFRARDSRRRWRSPFDPAQPDPAVAADFNGSDPRVVLWMPARFDVDGLLELLGGRRELARRLDRYFDDLGAGGDAPDHLPWVYAFSNNPDRLQALLADRLATDHARSADAAAWRVFASLGLYPVAPVRGDYVLALPAVQNARLEIGGKALLLEAPGRDGVLGAVHIDDRRVAGRTLSHRRLVQGGVLRFERVTTP